MKHDLLISLINVLIILMLLMVLMNNYDDTWSDVEVNAVVAFYSGK